MDFSDQAGYALTSWSRFDGAVTDELARAIACSFVLVACADGDLAREELEAFRDTLSGLEEHLPGLDLDQVQRRFADVGGAMLTDPAGGRKRAMDAIAAVKDSSENAELVRSAAEIAVAADHRSLPAESAALVAICDCLNLEPR